MDCPSGEHYYLAPFPRAGEGLGLGARFTLPPSYKYMYGYTSALDEEPLKGTPCGLENQDTSVTQER